MKTVSGVIEAIAPPKLLGGSWRSGVRVGEEWVNSAKGASKEDAAAFIAAFKKGLSVVLEVEVVKDAKNRDSNEIRRVVEAKAAGVVKSKDEIVADYKFFLEAARKMGLGEDKITAEVAMHLNKQFGGRDNKA